MHSATATEATNGAPGRPLRALILDDSDDDAVLLVRALRKQGFEPVTRRVDSREEMRRALSEAEWDIVISDYSMPGFTVSEALGLLRARDLDIPFLLVSGSVGEETAVAAMKAGAHDFFLKDRLARLGSAVERELRDAGVRRERRAAIGKLEASERELRLAVAARDEFLAIASHELRTPLTPLVLQLQSSLRRVRQERAAGAPAWAEQIERNLESSVRNVERMTLLVLNLLDVTRIAAGRLDVQRQRIDLQSLVAGVARRLKETTRTGNVQLERGPAVEGNWDPQMLESVVLNLLSNAVKFGRDKPIQVRVERVGDSARLSVRDEGIGISEADRERIFQRFERAVPAHHYGGFGLGLWVVAQIARAHGGSVSVSSAPDAGSTFLVELPIVPPAVG
jgi:two-component system sensor histidine kinase EvgS